MCSVVYNSRWSAKVLDVPNRKAKADLSADLSLTCNLPTLDSITPADVYRTTEYVRELVLF